MDGSDDDPDLARPDTREFLFPGDGRSALLVHGLTGTPYGVRYLGEQLSSAGIRAHGVRLAGHAGAPQELGAVTHANWYESVVDGLERLRAYGDPIVVVGLSMGAVLAARLAIEQPEAIAGIVLLAPAFFLPPLPRLVLRLLRPAKHLGQRIYFDKPGGPDIHDATVRRLHPGNRLMPLSAALNLVELSAYVRPKLRSIEQPALIIHSRNDHTCPFSRNTSFVMRHLGSRRKRLVTLEESFHVITVDSEKLRVAQEVCEFAMGFRTPAVSRAAHG